MTSDSTQLHGVLPNSPHLWPFLFFISPGAMLFHKSMTWMYWVIMQLHFSIIVELAHHICLVSWSINDKIKFFLNNSTILIALHVSFEFNVKIVDFLLQLLILYFFLSYVKSITNKIHQNILAMLLHASHTNMAL